MRRGFLRLKLAKFRKVEKVNKLRTLVGSLLLLCLAGGALAQDVNALDKQIRNLERLTDLGSNLELLRHPQKALDMADAVSEPELFVAAMVLSANPEIWLKVFEQANKPGALPNLTQLADPQLLVDWFYASIDPRFQRAILSRALDKNKMRRWTDSMNDPRFFMPAIAVMNPATAMQWIKVTADGRLIEPKRNGLGADPRSQWLRIDEPGRDPVAGSHAAADLNRVSIRRY